MNILQSAVITKDDGDINYVISTDTLTEPELVLEVQGLPASWDLAGRLNVLVNYGDEVTPKWVAVQVEDLRPYSPHLIAIATDRPYILMVRFVRYIKDCQVFVYKPSAATGGGPIPSDRPLDPYPGASLFALEQLYTSSAGPFYSGPQTSIATLIGTEYTATVTHGPIDVSNGYLGTDVEFSFLQSEGPVSVTANRFVVAILSVKGSHPNEDNRGLVGIGAGVIFKINDQDEMIVNAPRTDGGQSWANAGVIPSDDQFFLAAFLVKDNNLKAWINGTLSIDQFVDSIASANDIVRVFVRGVQFKLLATWDDTEIPENPNDVIQALMNHYQIT